MDGVPEPGIGEAHDPLRPDDALSPDDPLWAWAASAIRSRAEAMLKHIPGVREGADIEAVHDLRVGSRRLAAAMKVFAVCFPGSEYRRLVREVRRVTRRLGALRDLDVLADYYEKLMPELEPAERLAAEYQLAVFQRDRKKSRPPALEALDEVEEDELVPRLERFLVQEGEAFQVGLLPVPPWSAAGVKSGSHAPIHPEQSFRLAAPRLLIERLDTLLGFREYVTQPEAVEELHSMRIAAKWLRYTMELFTPAYADELADAIATVKKVQEQLGDLHDSDVRLDLLNAGRRGHLSARGIEALHLLDPVPVVESLTRLHAREQRTRGQIYRKFRRSWQKLETRGFPDACRSRFRTPDGGRSGSPGDEALDTQGVGT
jgi:CHAD domain-containing protein